MYLHWTDRKYRGGTIVIMLLLITFSACQKEKKPVPVPENFEPYNPTMVTPEYPRYFPVLYIPNDNPLTVEGIALGRRLYYDRKLSQNGPREGLSCSSCHFQTSSFTINTGGTAVLPHINLAWNRSFLWNGKIEGTLEDIMQFEVEEFFVADMEVLQDDRDYPSMFFKAFGSSIITRQKTEYALAQFFRTLVSTNSKYDRFMRRDVSLSPAELRGYRIFFQERGDCYHCHSAPLFTDNQFHNIGLDAVFHTADEDRSHVTGLVSDKGKFKTPTLRNIELTAPYMHDGRFNTLEEVVDHYNNGVKHSASLDPIMTKPGKELGLQLTEQDKSDLIAFLKTLTDTSYTINPDLSDPF